MRDLSGLRFGRLLVLDEFKDSPNTKWLCRCDCGIEKFIYRGSLLGGITQSCGCLRKEKSKIALSGKKLSLTHGKSYSRTYHIWQGIKDRCLNPKNGAFSRYGGRGISICDRWLKFENFLKDMGECPKDLTIERINNNGNYEHDNCRWATRQEQFLNRGHTSTPKHKEACRKNQKKALEALRKIRSRER